MYKDKQVFIQEDKNNAQTDKPDREFKQSGQPLAILKNNCKNQSQRFLSSTIKQNNVKNGIELGQLNQSLIVNQKSQDFKVNFDQSKQYNSIRINMVSPQINSKQRIGKISQLSKNSFSQQNIINRNLPLQNQNVKIYQNTQRFQDLKEFSKVQAQTQIFVQNKNSSDKNIPLKQQQNFDSQSKVQVKFNINQIIKDDVDNFPRNQKIEQIKHQQTKPQNIKMKTFIGPSQNINRIFYEQSQYQSNRIIPTLKKKKNIAFLQSKLEEKNIIISENTKIGNRFVSEDQELIEQIDEKLISYKDEKFQKSLTKFQSSRLGHNTLEHMFKQALQNSDSNSLTKSNNDFQSLNIQNNIDIKNEKRNYPQKIKSASQIRKLLQGKKFTAQSDLHHMEMSDEESAQMKSKSTLNSAKPKLKSTINSKLNSSYILKKQSETQKFNIFQSTQYSHKKFDRRNQYQNQQSMDGARKQMLINLQNQESIDNYQFNLRINQYQNSNNFNNTFQNSNLSKKNQKFSNLMDSQYQFRQIKNQDINDIDQQNVKTSSHKNIKKTIIMSANINEHNNKQNKKFKNSNIDIEPTESVKIISSQNQNKLLNRNLKQNDQNQSYGNLEQQRAFNQSKLVFNQDNQEQKDLNKSSSPLLKLINTQNQNFEISPRIEQNFYKTFGSKAKYPIKDETFTSLTNINQIDNSKKSQNNANFFQNIQKNSHQVISRQHLATKTNIKSAKTNRFQKYQIKLKQNENIDINKYIENQNKQLSFRVNSKSRKWEKELRNGNEIEDVSIRKNNINLKGSKKKDLSDLNHSHIKNYRSHSFEYQSQRLPSNLNLQNQSFEMQIPSKNQLSQLVLQENKQNFILNQYLNEIEEYQKKKLNENKFLEKYFKDNVNEKKVDLKTLQKQILTMNQLCSRLVSCEKNQVPILQPNIPIQIQIFSRMIPTKIKCKIENFSSPVQLLIDYSMNPNIQDLDLEIFYSTTNSNPNKNNFMERFANLPKKITVYSKEVQTGQKLKLFDEQNQYLYFTFMSQVGCALEMTFKGQIHKSKDKKNQNFDSVIQLNESNSLEKQIIMKMTMEDIDKIFPKNDPYYLEMVQQQQNNSKRLKDFQNQQKIPEKLDIVRNIKNLINYKNVFNHPNLKFFHTEQAFQKKEQIEQDSHKQKVFLLHKWKILRQIKNELINEKIQIFKRKKTVKNFLTQIILHPIFNIINTEFQKKIKANLLKKMSKLIAIKTYKNYKKSIERKGKNIDFRTQNYMRYGLSQIVTTMKESGIKSRAKQLICRFISFTCRCDEFISLTRKTFMHIEFIQKKFRILKEIMRQRIYALRHSILIKQIFLVNNSLSNENMDKYKQIIIKINSLSNFKKDFICEQIIFLAKMDFRLKFLQWFKNNKIDMNDENSQERSDEIQEGIDQSEKTIKKINDFFYDNQYIKTNQKQKKDGKKTIVKVDEIKIVSSELIDQNQNQMDQQMKEMRNQSQIRKSTNNTKSWETLKKQITNKNIKNENQLEEKKEVQLIDNNIIKAFGEIFLKKKMPSFGIYSKLEFNLIKMMCIKSSEYEDENLIQEYKYYINEC